MIPSYTEINLIEKITGLFSRRPHAVDERSSAQQSATSPPAVRPAPPSFPSPAPPLADRRFLAELRRYEVETDEIAAGIRDQDERRKNDHVDQWLLCALIVIAAVVLLVVKDKWSPYLSPALVAGVFLRLLWVTRGRGGPLDSS